MAPRHCKHVYCYDRAQSSALLRKHIPAQRKSCHDMAMMDPSLMETELVLRDWTQGRACADHDAHKALKWSMEPLQHESAHHIRIAIASLRDGWDILMKEISVLLIETAGGCSGSGFWQSACD
ncbi:unnamed protein product [Polarella glacialis]|uniref:Uncharacterized protein n=1 Tax=Polarella glacialis TaxID=89957 RepID=A0A813HSY8_POLGL|nr:unnamed protein product [Polarella glacialis]